MICLRGRYITYPVTVSDMGVRICALDQRIPLEGKWKSLTRFSMLSICVAYFVSIPTNLSDMHLGLVQSWKERRNERMKELNTRESRMRRGYRAGRISLYDIYISSVRMKG